jgi:U3 small nucleolar RNA-associated protein 21
VPTGRLIDAFKTSTLATSVAFSPANDFLATAHVDSVGVYLWSVGSHSMAVFLYTIGIIGRIVLNTPKSRFTVSGMTKSPK